MKKILIAGLIIIFFASTGYAEIEKKLDRRGRTEEIFSKTERVGPFRYIVFSKRKNSGNCELILSRSDIREVRKFPLQLVIGEQIYNLPMPSTIRKNRILGYNKGESVAWWNVGAVANLIQRTILRADYLAIRVRFYSRPVGTWIIPSRVLNEWKQVIRQKF